MAARILVIEDQEDNRRILRDLLTSVGFEVIEAVTGEEGVTLAESTRPDVIVMDIQLPGLDGYGATRHIKGNAALSAIPIIAVTSYALIGDDVKEWAKILADPTAHLHLYGKSEARPGRKMGHVTRLNGTTDC